MNAERGFVIDHIDGNTLDMRKQNMRQCTQDDNLKNRQMPITNRSGAKGVRWAKELNTPKWNAYLKKNNKSYNLGYFNNFEDAVEARRQAEIRYQGEFSRDYGDEVKMAELDFFDKNGERINRRKISHTRIACSHCVYWNKDKICDISNVEKISRQRCAKFERKEGY